MSRASRAKQRGPTGVLHVLCIPMAWLLLECLTASVALGQSAGPGVSDAATGNSGEQRLLDRLQRFQIIQKKRGRVKALPPRYSTSETATRGDAAPAAYVAGQQNNGYTVTGPPAERQPTEAYNSYRAPAGYAANRNDPYQSYRSQPKYGAPALGDNRYETGGNSTGNYRAHHTQPAGGGRQPSVQPAYGMPQPITPIGNTVATATALQPQTPGEIPELVPEERTPEQYYLPETQQPDADESAWQKFRRRIAGDSAAGLLKTYGAATWVFAGDNELGMFDVFLQGTFVVPWIKGFTVTPLFQVYFVDHPDGVDIPPRLYSTRVEFRLQRQLAQQFGIDLAVAPGVYSDFEQGDSDSFRLQVRALGVYYLAVNSQIVFGIVYLDREDVKLLPAIGWIWVPREDWRLELLFPRPKIAKRLSQHALYSRWGYVLGEFGGGSWSVERSNGQQDVLSYSDWRLILGLEQRYANGRSLFLEAGVVFNRELEFRSNVGDFDPSTAGLLRVGLNY